MLKIITYTTKFIVVTLTALLFASCQYSIGDKSITGSGNVTTENRKLERSFTSIEVSNAIDVVIEQSDKTTVIVEADDNIQNSIITKVENGVLEISSDYNSYVNVKSKKVIVKMPIIDELQASSAASIQSSNTLKGQKIHLRSSSAATIDIKAAYDNISARSSSASAITIKGMSLTLDATASSASTIKANELLTNDVTAKSSSASSIYTHPIVSLKARASSGSEIKYNIKPHSIERKASSGASIALE